MFAVVVPEVEGSRSRLLDGTGVVELLLAVGVADSKVSVELPVVEVEGLEDEEEGEVAFET